MGHLEDRDGKPRTTTKNQILDIWDTITDAESIRNDPYQRTPTRLRIGLALVKIGIKLLKKIV